MHTHSTTYLDQHHHEGLKISGLSLRCIKQILIKKGDSVKAAACSIARIIILRIEILWQLSHAFISTFWSCRIRDTYTIETVLWITTMNGSRTWNNLGSAKRDTYCINRPLLTYFHRSSGNRKLSSRIGSLDGKNNSSSSYGSQSPPRYVILPLIILIWLFSMSQWFQEGTTILFLSCCSGSEIRTPKSGTTQLGEKRMQCWMPGPVHLLHK